MHAVLHIVFLVHATQGLVIHASAIPAVVIRVIAIRVSNVTPDTVTPVSAILVAIPVNPLILYYNLSDMNAIGQYYGHFFFAYVQCIKSAHLDGLFL